MVTKECFTCWHVKPISEFYRNRLTPDGFERDCKKCKMEKAAVYKKKKLKKIDAIFGLQKRVRHLETILREKESSMTEPQKAQIWAAAQYLKEGQKAGVALRFMQTFPEIFNPHAIEAYRDEIRDKAKALMRVIGEADVLG